MSEGNRQGTVPPAVWAPAFAVHVLTASGAALGLLALLAATEAKWPAMFLWLALALLIDGVDGALARYFRVNAVLPRWSGETLDFVVDFVTYVFVPAFAIATGGIVPQGAAIPMGLVVVITGAIYFADRDMKMGDNCFRGFPALWNVVAFYLFLIRPNGWIAVAVIMVLAVLSFVRFPFVHPLRVERLRLLNIAMVAICGVLGLVALLRDLAPGVWVTAGLCATGLYFLLAGMIRLPAR
jgi:phosphatidylcholine synthase